MTLAKPLAGGLPIGAALMKQHVADAMAPGESTCKDWSGIERKRGRWVHRCTCHITAALMEQHVADAIAPGGLACGEWWDLADGGRWVEAGKVGTLHRLP